MPGVPQNRQGLLRALPESECSEEGAAFLGVGMVKWKDGNGLSGG